MEAAIRSVQVGQRADTASNQPPASISYQQRIPSGASPIHRPVDTPQSYSKGPQPTPAASPQTYRVPSRETIRYVPQNPYGTMQPNFREAPYVRVPQVPQVEYRSAPISVPANISISHGLPPTSTIETVSNNVPNRPRISLLPEDRRIPNEYLASRPQQAAPPDPGGPPAFKKIRLTENHSQSPPPLLKVDIRDPPSTGAYHPQVEAISPTPPNDPSEELRATKDDLLQKIAKVDLEINKAEKTIAMLKTKQASLEETTAKPAKAEEIQEVQPKHRSLAQKIYAENRKKANAAHEALGTLGPQVELPLYNQPSDVEICKEIIQRHQSFKSRLLLHLKKIKSERAARNTALADKYSLLSQEWLRRVEKVESSAKRKAKEAKNREFFEKVFTELRKQREDKERFNRVGSRIKSEADVEEIIDGLQEQANEDKKMRSYAVIPPLILDAKQKKYVFHNENGAVTDMENDFKQDRKNLNVWTTGEKEIFKEKFLQHPKNFGAIAASLDRKSAQDCVRYYYLSKKTENYKQLLRKSRQRTRSSRNPNKSNQTQSQCIVDAMTTGVTTRLQREQQQKTGARAANSANITPPQATTGSTTPPNSLPSQFTSQNRCPPAETTASTTNSTNNATESSSTAAAAASTTTSNANESESTSVAAKTGDTTDTSSKSTDVDKDKSDESLQTDGKAANTTNSSSGSALPADGTAASATISGNPTQTTVTAPTTSSASNTNCASIMNTVNGVKTDIVTSLANKTTTTTTTTSNAPSKENAAQLTNSSQPTASANASSPPSDGDNAKLDNKAVDTSVSSAVNAVASNANEEEDKLDECDAKKRRKEASESTEDDSTVDSKEKLHPCFVCKEENCLRTRPLEKGRGQQYGISDDAIPAGARVCNTCQCKSVRNRYPSCPLPTCPNPKDRVKRFRNLPARLFELAPEIRDPIMQEFEIPANVTKCCSACLIKIKRKLGPHLLGTNLTDEEITKFKSLLQEVGPKWSQLAETMSKTAVALKSFYFHYKKKYSFDLAVTEYYKSHPSEERRSAITDGDESDLSTSSCDEHEGGSDTASVESPKTTSNSQTSISSVSAKKEESMESTPASNTDDRLLPPVAQPPRKQKIEEYDSSATETADEENETSPGNRHSPKVLLYPNQTTITVVPSIQNGPREPMNTEMTNVRDVMLNVIERTLKNSQQPPPMKPNIAKPSVLDSRADITFVHEYRNDIGKPHHISSMASVTQPTPLSRTSNQEGLATLSVVNSHGHTQQVLSHPHSISSQIAATITPVQTSTIQNQSVNVPKTMHDAQKDGGVVVYSRAEEPQTLDLSIKKPARDNFPPPAHSKPMSIPIPGSSVTMYRSDPHSHGQQPPSIVNPGPGNYLSAMYDHNRPSKSPSIYMSPVPTSLPMSQQPPNSQHSIQSMRAHQNPSILSQVSQQVSISAQSKVKAAPKLSPKVTQHPSNNQQSGHKGSITHGTPVNANNQQILIQGPATLSPRFDGILRQTPPSSDKLGSITQGTPVHLPPHHLTDKQRVYDYYKNRQSPAQPPQQPSPQAATFGSPYQVRPSGPYAIEQPTQLSSRQIIMNDFITSQQMHGQARGRSDKESPSPRSTGVAGSPASLYYAEKEQQQRRAEYLSRTSPAEHINSTPSPHRTPPPQRQGVIQRHNAGGSKPPSPAPNRLHIIPQHHYPLPGHEAFSSLVDVAVQLPSLPVPHKDEKRQNIPVSEPAHHDIRFHPHIAAAHEQMALLHQRQMQAEMQRRHQHIQQERERADRERERERERHHQDRMERERREEQFRQQRGGDRWKSPEREHIERERERERERIALEEQEHERRREAAKLMANANPYLRDGQNIPRDRPGGRPNEGNLTAASLIDAIITHQINQTASEPPAMRECHRPPYFPVRDLHPENNGKSHSPNVINIELDSDRRNLTKSFKMRDLSDTVILKDYSQSPVVQLRQPAFMPFRPDAEHWKINARLAGKDGMPPQPQPPQQLPPPQSHNQGKPSVNPKVTLHEVNSARSASPRTTKAYHESMTQPENYHYAAASAHSRMPSQQSSGHPFALDCYVKNRIVEAMRTEESDKRGDELSDQQRRTPQERPTPSSSAHHNKDIDRSSTPGDMVIDEESQIRPNSGTAERKENWPSFQPSTYAYPFSALNVSSAATNLPPPMKTAHIESESASRSQQSTQEPKPLLSAQYEALSDED